MKPGTIFWLLFAGAMFLIFAPHVVDREHSARVAAAEVPGAAQAKTLAWYAGETVLDRKPDGHFYADATVEGAPVRFLVDTGATVVLLTGEDAAAAGLSWNEDDVHVVAQGASGPIYGVPATLAEVSLGGIDTHAVPAMIVPHDLPISLLGQSFLSRVGNIDVSDDKMTLGGAQ